LLFHTTTNVDGETTFNRRPHTLSTFLEHENMGSVFGKESVKEPPHEVLLARKNGKTPYEMRRYGVRYAAWTPYDGDNSSPFRSLARYIGVFGTPENEGKEAIAMVSCSRMRFESAENDSVSHFAPFPQTAPVVMEKGEPESIAMVRDLNPSVYSQRTSLQTRLIIPALTTDGPGRDGRRGVAEEDDVHASRGVRLDE